MSSRLRLPDVAVLRALVIRPVRRRPWRFFITVVGVATGVAAVVATVASSRAAVRSFTRGVEEVAGSVRLEVHSAAGVPIEVLSDLRPIAEDAVVVPVVEDSLLLVELGDGVRLLGVDLLLDDEVRPVMEGRLDPGSLQEALIGQGVLISDELAGEIGVAPGDAITVSARGRPRRVTVVALVDADRHDAVWERIVLADVALAQELLGRTGRLDRIELVPRPGVEVDDLRQRVLRLIPDGLEVAAPSRRRVLAEQMVASLRFNLVALSAISVLVGGVLVATTLATSVVQRRYTVALLRSLGASRLQVASAVLVEAAGLGLAGGALGVLAGFGGARLALASVRSTVAAVLHGVPATTIRLEPWLAAFGIGLALVTAFGASVLPLIEVVATPPLQGLRGSVPAKLRRRSRRRIVVAMLVLMVLAVVLTQLPSIEGLPVAALLAALLVMAVLLAGSGLILDAVARLGHHPSARRALPVIRWTLSLASAALSAGRRRASWATGAVAVAVALAVAIATMVTSFRATVVQWTEDGMRADVWVRPLPGSTGAAVGRLDPDLVRLAETMVGADAVDPFYAIDITYEGRPISFAGAAFDVVRHFGSVPFPGRESGDVFARALAGRSAVVNEPFFNRFGAGRGDTIHLDLPGGGLDLEIEGVFTDYSRSHGLVVVDREIFLRYFPDRGPEDMALFLPPGIDARQVRQRFLQAVRGRYLVEALVNRELKRSVLAAFERTFAITTALYLVAATVSVIAVATVLLTLLGERRRELATVRAIGGSRSQLAAMVVVQAALLGGAAASAGSVAGLVVGVILVKVVNLQSFGWSLLLVFPGAELVGIGAWVLVGCLVAGISPAVLAARLEPAEALREDG